MDSGGGDDAAVVFSAALTGAVIKGATVDGDLGLLSSTIVGDVVPMPGGRLESSSDFGVGTATFGVFIGSILTALCIAAPKPGAT